MSELITQLNNLKDCGGDNEILYSVKTAVENMEKDLELAKRMIATLTTDRDSYRNQNKELQGQNIALNQGLNRTQDELEKVRAALRTCSTLDSITATLTGDLLDSLPVGFALAHTYYFDHDCIQEWSILPLHALALEHAIAQGKTPTEAMQAGACYLASWENRVKAAHARRDQDMERKEGTDCGCNCKKSISEPGEKAAD